MSQKFAKLIESGEFLPCKMSSFYYPDRVNVITTTPGASMTRQEFAEECDVNVIIDRFQKTGIWPYPDPEKGAIYWDFEAAPTDLRGAMEHMMAAEEAFMTLPAKVRKEFDNDPLKFVDFADDPGNLAQMKEWGLLAPEKVPDAPVRVEVVSGAPSSSPAPAGSPAP